MRLADLPSHLRQDMVFNHLSQWPSHKIVELSFVVHQLETLKLVVSDKLGS